MAGVRRLVHDGGCHQRERERDKSRLEVAFGGISSYHVAKVNFFSQLVFSIVNNVVPSIVSRKAFSCRRKRSNKFFFPGFSFGRHRRLCLLCKLHV